MPVLEPPSQEQHEESEHENRRSLIGLPDTAWAMPHMDDDDSDSDQDRAQATKKHCTAFDNVRNKLISSISHSSNNDHLSHVSVGNSEEEIARRAELKRIMHQRIQNELKSDEPDESDDHIENKPTNCLPRLTSVADLTLPNSGPRDAIEFGVSKSSSRNGQLAQLDSDEVNHDTTSDSQVSQHAAIRSKRISSREHVSSSEDADVTQSQNSFQLSNGAGRLDRILGPDSSFNSRHASSGDAHSVLGVWLIAQGLRSRDNSTLVIDEKYELEPTEETKQTYHNTSLSEEEKEDQPQEPRGTSANRILEDSHGPSVIEVSDTAETRPGFSLNAQNDRHEIPSLSEELPWGPTVTALLNSFTDNTSSSGRSKSQPSPIRSQQNLYKLDPKDLESMEFSPFRWYYNASSHEQANINDQNSKGFISTSQPRPQFYGNIRNGESPAQVPHDTTSLAHSESASFVQREAELGSIRRRFSEALALKKPEKRVNTRFREEFSESLPPSAVQKSFRRKSQLAMPSHLRAKSKSIDLRSKEGISSTPKANHLLVPVERLGRHEREAIGRSRGRSNLSIRPHMSRLPTEEYRMPSLERRESATDLWQRAIRLEAERRHSSSIYLSTPKLGQRSQSSNRSLNGSGAARNSTNSVSDTRQEVSRLTPTTDELSSPGNSRWLIERWVATMRPKSGESAKDTSSTRFMGPPRSWSRFPSHTREERNKNAADRDRVQPRDFAIKHMTSEGQIRWATDVPLGEEKPRSRTLPRSFSTKLGELVKSKMGRIIPSKGVRRRVSQDHFIRHPALSLALMEYPEMGIRPSESGYTELQALGREISNMKRESHLQSPERGLSKPHSSRSLGDRVVALMNEAIGQKHSKHDATVESAECPTVPPTPILVRESLAATDVFVTPRSRFSNDALEEGEESDDETDSIKVKDQKIQLTLPESNGNAPRNNFSTSTKEVGSDSQLTTFKKASN
ncbi:hypothetical protein FBEOM_4057 [Fusarium beomiforme]|uniref:Uncharacterized protein n=1 Tax=Fusarium beomiforme TaxID=44412 RepID=A0A9P5AQG9_9HYPO|nr:hypothetical protein FBEOM_4057 [Fusarium beomiforme]